MQLDVDECVISCRFLKAMLWAWGINRSAVIQVRSSPTEKLR